MIALSFDRTGLSLTPLVVTEDPFGTKWHIDEDGITWPSFETRRDYVPDSNFANGRMLRSAVLGAAEMALTIYAHGDTTAELEANKAELAAAVAQWSYDLTLTVDGAVRTYSAEVVLDLPWGAIDSGMVRAHMARTSFSIPLNP